MIKIALTLCTMMGILASIANYEVPTFENYHIANCTGFVSIGKQINEARVEKRMSPATLAKKSGLSLKQLSEVEAGKAEPVQDVIVNIEKILESTFIYEGYYRFP